MKLSQMKRSGAKYVGDFFAEPVSGGYILHCVRQILDDGYVDSVVVYNEPLSDGTLVFTGDSFWILTDKEVEEHNNRVAEERKKKR